MSKETLLEVGVLILFFLRSLLGCKEFCSSQTSALKSCILSPFGLPPSQGSLGTVGTLETFWRGAVETMEEDNLPPCSLLAQPLGECQLPLCDTPDLCLEALWLVL